MTDYPLLDADKFEAAVREVVEANPHKVYSMGTRTDRAYYGLQCAYVHVEKGELVGGCVLGTALVHMGVPVETVAELDVIRDDTTTESTGAEAVLPRFELSEDTIMWAQDLQGAQDNSSAWGEALAHADRRRAERNQRRELEVF